MWSLLGVKSFSGKAKFEETRGFGPTCAADRKKNWKVKQDPFVVDKIFLCCS